MAFAFRQEFGHDVLIDLIGYRRFGHNESDEPAYTQPEMYAKIKTKKRVYELWADQLVADGVVSREDVERTGQEVWDNLTILHQRLKAKIAAAAEHGSRGAEHRRVPARPHSEPRRGYRGARRARARAGTGAAAHARRVHRAPEARQAAGAPPRGAREDGADAPRRVSTGPTPRRSRSPRC